MLFKKSDSKKSGQRKIPLLPLRNLVVFPDRPVPLFVGREKSMEALNRAMADDQKIMFATQRKAKTNHPSAEDIYEIGTIAHIHSLLRMPDGNVKAFIEGLTRARIVEFSEDDDSLTVEAIPVDDAVPTPEQSVELEVLMRSVKVAFENYVKLNKNIYPELAVSMQTLENPARLAHCIAFELPMKVAEKQALLEMDAPQARLEKMLEFMQAEIEILQVEKKIRTRVKKQMEKTQKEFYLNEQMNAIQKEMGDRDEFKNEITELEDKIKNKAMSKEAKDRLVKEMKKLKMMSPMSAEATVVRNYIDWVISLPWEDKTQDRLDVVEAEKVLDEDHYGLAKVKERILEHLAVQSLVAKIKGPILCLVGPPGVGKTSLARSVARATGRNFVRLSLGGVRDEAEIRGHRRTYIGALPGKIIQSLKKAGSSNPVFLLDEIDKMSTDFRGDPSAALLEVLDPEQNNTFNDHYLDLDYDLSDVMFITTANSLHSIPVPLQDRMEIIQLPGYTEWEKVAIAEKYLVPKEKVANGVGDVEVDFTEPAVRSIIQHYTKEAGVRSLEREIATVYRKIAKEVVADRREATVGDGKPSAEKPAEKVLHADKKSKVKSFKITPQNLAKFLDVQRYRDGRQEEKDEIGLCNGLAVTMHGGDILPSEVTVMPGKGKLVLTGKLGEVMQESAQAVMSYIRSRSDALGLERDFYAKVDTHIHFPEGAIPKDGPSAGVTMAVALASALLRIPVRRDVAMTGEITLRGRVLPIGGLKDKVLAAHRAEIYTVIIPRDNEKDLKDIPKHVLKAMTVIAVDHLDEVLRTALRLDKPEEFLTGGRTSALDWRDVRPVEDRPSEPPRPSPVGTDEPGPATPSTH